MLPMNGMANLALLFVAVGLLLLVAVAARRRSDRVPSSGQTASMAFMTGLALGFLALVFFSHPYMLFPVGVGGVLLVSWIRDSGLVDV
jgi:hypothetical protein